MNILMITDWSPYVPMGGAELTIKSLSESLSIDYKFFLISLKASCPIPNPSAFKVIEIGPFWIRKKPSSQVIFRLFDAIRVPFDIVTPFLVLRASTKLSPDIVLVHQSNRVGPFFLPFLKFFRPEIPIIRVFHDLSDTCLRRTRFTRGATCEKTCLKCRPKFSQYRWSNSFADHSVYVSHFLKKRFKDLYSLKDDGVVGYPLTIKRIKDQGSSSSTIAKGARTRVGFVGRVTPEKGIGLIIEKLGENPQEYILHIYGNGDARYMKKLVKTARDLSLETYFHGYSDKVFSDIVKSVDVVVVPTLIEEAFGRVALEALECGLPIYVSNMGGLPEITKLVVPEQKTFEIGNLASFHADILLAKNEKRPMSISGVSQISLNQQVLEFIRSIQ